MPWLTPNFSIDDARSARQETYDLIISNWGGVDTFPSESWQFPAPGKPGLVSLAGIAIGPRSTVDRAWVSWNLQKAQATKNAALPLVHRVSVGSPLMFGIPAKEGFIPSSAGPDVALAQQQGNLYIFPFCLDQADSATFTFPDITDNTFASGAYKKANSNTVVDIGPTQGDKWAGPTLHLVLYLKAPYLPAPSSRFPYQAAKDQVTLTGGSENLIAQVPVYGRKHVVVTLRPSVISDLRVGSLRCQAPFIEWDEAPEETRSAAPANQTQLIELCEPCADYINIYATPTASGTLAFSVTAYD